MGFQLLKLRSQITDDGVSQIFQWIHGRYENITCEIWAKLVEQVLSYRNPKLKEHDSRIGTKLLKVICFEWNTEDDLDDRFFSSSANHFIKVDTLKNI